MELGLEPKSVCFQTLNSKLSCFLSEDESMRLSMVYRILHDLIPVNLFNSSTTALLPTPTMYTLYSPAVSEYR